MVVRLKRELCGLGKEKKIQLHIKCAQAFHGLSNQGAVCDAQKTQCLISCKICARADACACMWTKVWACTTHTCTAAAAAAGTAVKPVIT